MSNGNEPTKEDRNGDEPESGDVRDPQVVVVAAAAFVGGLVGAIVGGMIT